MKSIYITVSEFPTSGGVLCQSNATEFRIDKDSFCSKSIPTAIEFVSREINFRMVRPKTLKDIEREIFELHKLALEVIKREARS